MLHDPMPPQLSERRPAAPVTLSTEPVSIGELLKRSQIMLQNIQSAFLHPDPNIEPKEARAAMAAAGPLLKLILEKAPQMAENRHAIFEDSVVEVLGETDETYKAAFLNQLREKLEIHSIRLATP